MNLTNFRLAKRFRDFPVMAGLLFCLVSVGEASAQLTIEIIGGGVAANRAEDQEKARCDARIKW